jgi:hypothetical protein
VDELVAVVGSPQAEARYAFISPGSGCKTTPHGSVPIAIPEYPHPCLHFSMQSAAFRWRRAQPGPAEAFGSTLAINAKDKNVGVRRVIRSRKSVCCRMERFNDQDRCPERREQREQPKKIDQLLKTKKREREMELRNCRQCARLPRVHCRQGHLAFPFSSD